MAAILRHTSGIIYPRSISGALVFASGATAQLANGTAAAPSLTFDSQGNNDGLYYDTVNGNVSMSFNGAQKWASDGGAAMRLVDGLALPSAGTITWSASTMFAAIEMRLYRSGTRTLDFDNGAGTFNTTLQSGALLVKSATLGLGYGSGAGGTVTQATSKSTGVTLNTVTGIITMNGAALAADTTVSFTLTDSAIAATDAVVVVHESVGTLGAYSFAATGAAGSAAIAVHNNTPGSLSEAIVLRFVVIKSVNA